MKKSNGQRKEKKGSGGAPVVPTVKKIADQWGGGAMKSGTNAEKGRRAKIFAGGVIGFHLSHTSGR